ncbi:DUF6185 family protein [Streptomyces sp. WAC06614]|uniref:DUF6185 family protein n=1 Tax=Streptomyces sp. WAC06614 TaxID=2487416 RepID=UPI000F7A3860|nr:DUF6185 family protein [Streptomyces sp. WAC06614]RSS79868.1 hypothetical protein EF918_15700 [Streptomyces sp. WAC06614]
MLLVVTVLWWAGAGTARAHAGDRDACRADLLDTRGAQVTAKIAFEPHAHNQASSEMTVHLSRAWPLAGNLAFGPKTPEYRLAIRCLFREAHEDLRLRRREWRFEEPRVTMWDDGVTVRYEAIAFIERPETFRLGPWEIRVDGGQQRWHVLLRPPSTLAHARWDRVEVDLGGLDDYRVRPVASATDAHALVWSKPAAPAVQIDVDPPWQHSYNVGTTPAWPLVAGIVSWWVFASGVIVVAAVRTRRAQPAAAPAGPPEPPVRIPWVPWRRSGRQGRRLWEGPAPALLQWAVLSLVVALMLRVNTHPPAFLTMGRVYLVAVLTGLALTLLARPWAHTASPDTPGPGPAVRPAACGVRRRQALALVSVAVVTALLASLVVLAPRLFGLRTDLVPEDPHATRSLVALVVLGVATLWLWLVAMAAWAWRFAREGGLVRRTWMQKWDEQPVRRTLAASALLAVAAGALPALMWWTHQYRVQRLYWLSEQSGIDLERPVFLRGFALTGLTWLYAYAWLLTAIALVALLHFRVEAAKARTGRGHDELAVGPSDAELLLTVAVFTLAVGLRHVTFAGANVLFGLWLLLNLASLYALVAVGRRCSVLGRAGAQFCTQRLGTAQRRQELLVKAHQYRNVRSQLSALDRGKGEGGLSRKKLETTLRELQQWLFAGWEKDKGQPPTEFSVQDIALSWGPGGHWWDNARHAARLAFWFGLPASAALVYLTYFKDARTQRVVFTDLVGVPEIAAKFLSWQIAWAGAGLVLGALWRLLPGRRSPVRALSLTAAYAVPLGLGALVSRITDAQLGLVFLNILLMLLVLTLTGMWLDMLTFADERMFYSSRYGLLASIYQLRGMSTQVAYVVAQLVVVVQLWRQLVGSDSAPR